MQPDLAATAREVALRAVRGHVYTPKGELAEVWSDEVARVAALILPAIRAVQGAEREACWQITINEAEFHRRIDGHDAERDAILHAASAIRARGEARP